MRNENYIVIQGWMVNELELSGNELLCYALIYGFSQDNESSFSGSRKYIARFLGVSSLNTVDKVLSSLINKNLIVKHSNILNGVTFNSYKVNNAYPIQKMNTPYSNFEHYNNSNINIDNKEIEDKSSTKKEVDEFIERMYALYPTHCPKRNHSLCKTRKDKDRIRKLLKCYSMDEIERVFKHEIEEKYEKQYMQNFSTFLNNFPDPNGIKQQNLFSPCDIDNGESVESSNMIIDGQIYR